MTNTGGVVDGENEFSANLYQVRELETVPMILDLGCGRSRNTALPCDQCCGCLNPDYREHLVVWRGDDNTIVTRLIMNMNLGPAIAEMNADNWASSGLSFTSITPSSFTVS